MANLFIMIACFEFRQRFGFYFNFLQLEKKGALVQEERKNISQRKGRKRKECICRRRFLIKKQSYHGNYFSHESTGYHSFLISVSECLMLFVNIGKNMKNCHF